MTKEIDIPKGYKKTKVGVIPKEWEVKRINQFASLASGGTPNREISEYWNGDIPWITTTLINGKIIHSSEEYISTDGLNNSSAKIFSKETILMAMYGQGQTRGRVSKLGIEAATNQACAAITPDSSVNTDFLIEFLSLNYANIRKLSNTGNQKNLNLQLIKTIPVKVPPLPEQQKIASILTTWDKAIEHVQLVIDNLKVRNKGLAQQLLTGKKRLKGFEGEWKKYTLNDIAIRVKRRNSELNDNVITISAQRGFVLQEEFFNKRVASATLSNYYLLVQGEFAYNKSYSKGYPMGAFKRLNNLNKAVVTTLYICFKLKANVNSNFMEQFFEAGLMTKNLMRIAQEGGRAHGLLNIGLSDFFNLKLIIPSLKEQHAISKILEEANQELKLYEKKLVTLQEQKKGLMQKLLTGEIRVKTEKL